MDLKLTKIYKNSIINSEFHPTGQQYGGVPPGNPSLTDDRHKQINTEMNNR